MFCERAKPRAGVASTYVEFERSEKLYLVTCDQVNIYHYYFFIFRYNIIIINNLKK